MYVQFILLEKYSFRSGRTGALQRNWSVLHEHNRNLFNNRIIMLYCTTHRNDAISTVSEYIYTMYSLLLCTFSSHCLFKKIDIICILLHLFLEWQEWEWVVAFAFTVEYL